MSRFKSMSRTELVRELVAPPNPVITAGANPQPLASCDSIQSSASDAVVSHKLAVARELLLRKLAADMRSGPIMECPGAVRDWIRLRYARLEYEMFIMLHLDVQHRLIDAEEMSRGTLTFASVFPREIVKSALARNASSVVFVHNHPSGNAQPSQPDCTLTQRLKSALALVDVHVADHLIVAGNKVFSFAERGML